MRLKYHYPDLIKAGLGSRNTIKAMIRRGEFPAPMEDVDGRPVWPADVIEKYMAEWRTKLKPYTPSTPTHLAA